jgi:hypothetical protein
VDENDLWYGKIESLRVDKRAKALQVCVHKQLIYHDTSVKYMIGFLYSLSGSKSDGTGVQTFKSHLSKRLLNWIQDSFAWEAKSC